MLGILLTAALAVAAAPDVQSPKEDAYIEVTSVELPSEGFDPRKMSLVIRQAVSGCRKAATPVIQRQNSYIRILPRSEMVAGRCPSSSAVRETSQIVQLGRLERGTYRVRVVTEKSRVYKILNIY